MTARRRVLDVRALPTNAFGHRDPLWWAVILLVCIEGTMLVLLTLSYFYLRGRMTPWPVAPIPRLLTWVGTGELALWLVTALPMHRASRAAVAGSVRGMRWGLILSTIPAVIALAARFWILYQLPFRWDANAYASTVYVLLAAQWLHGLTGAGENLLYIVLLFKGPVEDKHRADIEVSTPLWYFVLAGGLLVWLVLFARPAFGGNV